ncbi:MAG: hypothetical protein K9N51_03815 [Candidatus Pacebacteria bacterium]|nr:hypothetical protein [Candidatus Paceibacterota bacterium]
MIDLKLIPHDVLFFRDARPMAAGEGYGHGAQLPMPHHLHSAVRTALLRDKGDLGEVKKAVKGRNRQGVRERTVSSTQFDDLRTVGPFLHHLDHGPLFPIPKDVLAIGPVKSADGKTTVDEQSISTSRLENVGMQVLPLSAVPASKNRIDGFWDARQLSAYLSGDKHDFTAIGAVTSGTVAMKAGEWRMGIKIDPTRQSTVQGKIYAAEYMRLADGMSFVGQAGSKNSMADGALAEKHLVVFGGERKLCDCVAVQNCMPEFCRPIIDGNGRFLVKWVLLTPALFRGGSIPGWCMNTSDRDSLADGDVRLFGVDRPPKIRLLTHAVGDSINLSGWDTVGHHPKATVKAVPAGAVYWFLCENGEAAAALVHKLHWQPRSDMYGEKGYGYGVCATAPTQLEFPDSK